MSDNLVFFKKNSFNQAGSFGKSRNILKSGQYLGELLEIKQGQRKTPKTGELEDTLAFLFELLDNGQVLPRTVKASNSIKGACFALVNDMAPISLDVLKDTEKFQAHILGLVGLTFLLHIEPSKCGKYNNVVRVTPDCRPKA